MIIQWFPGHMAKTKRLLSEHRKKVDVFIEVLDSRIPLSSRNPLLEELLPDTLRLLLLNKSDLADPKTSGHWLNHWENDPHCAVMLISAKDVSLKNSVIQGAVNLARRNGVQGRVRAMVVGIPNCGKSTLINLLSGGKKAPVGAKPGFTKSLQRIKVRDDFELLDTPGILWHKFELPSTGVKLALLGSIKEEILDRWELCKILHRYFIAHPAAIKDRFGIELAQDFVEFMEDLGRRRGMLGKGGVVDYERAASMLLREFQDGKLGRISLESPDDLQENLWEPVAQS